MKVSHEGGVFTTRLVSRKSKDAIELQKVNRDLIKALGLLRGVTHAEFIKADEDVEYYFLEIVARVGGANIAETIESATGLNFLIRGQCSWSHCLTKASLRSRATRTDCWTLQLDLRNFSLR
jgi:biotin carboxylase